MDKDPYEILNVPKDASEEEIKRVWKRLQRLFHPDRVAGDPDLEEVANQKTKEINWAYELLSSEEKRREYDAEYEATPVRPPSYWSDTEIPEEEILQAPQAAAGAGFPAEWWLLVRVLNTLGIVIWSGVLLSWAFLGGLIIGGLLWVVVWIPWFIINYSETVDQPGSTIGDAADATPWWGSEFAGGGAVAGSALAAIFVLTWAYTSFRSTWR